MYFVIDSDDDLHKGATIQDVVDKAYISCFEDLIFFKGEKIKVEQVYIEKQLVEAKPAVAKKPVVKKPVAKKVVK